MSFPEGLDCDQASAVNLVDAGSTDISNHVLERLGWRLKDPRQQSTKVEKLETIVSELFTT